MSERRNFNIRREIRKYGSDILKSENFRSSAGNIQHSNVSVMKHSMKVAYTSMWICEKFKIKCNRKDLVRGALLHDYFLYDWHDDDHRGLKNLHGFYHPADDPYQQSLRSTSLRTVRRTLSVHICGRWHLPASLNAGKPGLLRRRTNMFLPWSLSDSTSFQRQKE